LEDRYIHTSQVATAGPTGALLLVTRHTNHTTTSSSKDTHHSRQQQQQQQQQWVDGVSGCSSWLSSKKLLGQSIAPAVEPDEDDV
jgi:hypothetical protein